MFINIVHTYTNTYLHIYIYIYIYVSDAVLTILKQVLDQPRAKLESSVLSNNPEVLEYLAEGVKRAAERATNDDGSKSCLGMRRIIAV